MPASKHELTETKLDDMDFEFFKSPIEIKDKYISFCEIEKIECENNQFKFISHYNKISNMEADSIIIAISQGPKKNIISTCNELKVDKNGLLVCDEFGKTTKK